MKYLSITLVILFSILFFQRPVFAQTSRGITVKPAFLDITIDPKSPEKTFSVTFINNTSHDVSLQIFPVDFKQQDSQGSLGFLNQQAGSYSYSLSSFLTFDTSNLEIAKQGEETLHVTVTNRPDLSPGGHYAAIVGRLKPGIGDTEVAPAVTSLILLRKTGGERYNLYLKEVNFSKSIFQFSYPRAIELLFENEGNVHLTPYGRIDIKDMFGRELYKGILNSSSAKVFPESLRYISVDMEKLGISFPISFNTIEIKGEDSLNKTNFIYNGSYIYLNPELLLGIVVFIGFLIWIRKKKGKKHGKK